MISLNIDNLRCNLKLGWHKFPLGKLDLVQDKIALCKQVNMKVSFSYKSLYFVLLKINVVVSKQFINDNDNEEDNGITLYRWPIQFNEKLFKLDDPTFQLPCPAVKRSHRFQTHYLAD